MEGRVCVPQPMVLRRAMANVAKIQNDFKYDLVHDCGRIRSKVRNWARKKLNRRLRKIEKRELGKTHATD